MGDRNSRRSRSLPCASPSAQEIEWSETVLKKFDSAVRCAVLALLLLLLFPPDLSAQLHSPPGQRGTQEKNAPQQAAATPSDSILVPDGTPLTLRLVSDLSSATAKVGDAVQFTAPYPLRISGLVVVPRGAAVSGTVVQVRRPHRPSKNGQVSVVIEKVALPGGEIAALRHSKAATRKPASVAPRPEPGDLSVGGAAWRAPLDPITFSLVLPVALFTKGHELVYPAGTRTTVFFNGPLNLGRTPLLNSQPPPYKGPPQVFFNDTAPDSHRFDALFCGDVHLGPFAAPIKLVLKPGTYSFTARMDVSKEDFYLRASKKMKERMAKEELESKLKAKALQIEILEDHQYWIERERRGLFVKDLQQHQTEFDLIQGSFPLTEKDFTSVPPQDSCPQAARP